MQINIDLRPDPSGWAFRIWGNFPPHEGSIEAEYHKGKGGVNPIELKRRRDKFIYEVMGLPPEVDLKWVEADPDTVPARVESVYPLIIRSDTSTFGQVPEQLMPPGSTLVIRVCSIPYLLADMQIRASLLATRWHLEVVGLYSKSHVLQLPESGGWTRVIWTVSP